MIDEIRRRYARYIFVENLSDYEMRDLIIAYNRGGYASDGPLFAGVYNVP